MHVLDLKIKFVKFSQSARYKLIFQDKYETEISEASDAPIFQTSQFRITNSYSVGGESSIKLSVILLNNGEDNVVSTEYAALPIIRSETDYDFSFSKIKGHQVEGSISVSYKFSKVTLLETLRNEDIFCLSVNGAHLNTLYANPFELKLVAKVSNTEAESAQIVVGNMKISDHSPSTYVIIDSQYINLAIELAICDSSNNFHSVLVQPNRSIVVPIPMSVGEPIVLTIQLIVGSNNVTGVFHSSSMRDGSISTTIGSSVNRKVSLSPRRTSNFDSGAAAAAGMINTGKLVPSSKKTLLFVEYGNSAVGGATASKEFILEGITPAIHVDDAGWPMSDQIIRSNTASAVSSRSSVSTSTIGVYIECHSRSETLDIETTKKKTHKKQLQATNLGLLKLPISSVEGPFKLKVTIIDLRFDLEEADSSMTTAIAKSLSSGSSLLSTYRQRCNITFVGTLIETSREMFNDTGLIACTLEGNLLKPSSTAAAVALNDVSPTSDVLQQHHATVLSSSSEETCMAVRLYLSLVQQAKKKTERRLSSINSNRLLLEASKEEENEKELNKNNEKKDENGRPASVTSRRGSKQQTTAKSSSSRPASNNSGLIDYREIDKEIMLASQNNNNSDPDNIVKSASSLSVNMYNVVTAQTAFPGELTGSSIMNIPTQVASTEDLLQLRMKKSASNNSTTSKNSNSSSGGMKKLFEEQESHFEESDLEEELDQFTKQEASEFGENLSAAALHKSITSSKKKQQRKHNRSSHRRLRSNDDNDAEGRNSREIQNDNLTSTTAAVSSNNSAGAVGVVFAEVVRSELEGKQKRIDELMEEVKMRTEVIEVMQR